MPIITHTTIAAATPNQIARPVTVMRRSSMRSS